MTYDIEFTSLPYYVKKSVLDYVGMKLLYKGVKPEESKEEFIAAFEELSLDLEIVKKLLGYMTEEDIRCLKYTPGDLYDEYVNLLC